MASTLFKLIVKVTCLFSMTFYFIFSTLSFIWYSSNTSAVPFYMAVTLCKIRSILNPIFSKLSLISPINREKEPQTDI